MNETHPLDPPPSDVIGVQQSFSAPYYDEDPTRAQTKVLMGLYERLALQKRVPVGIVEGGWYYHYEVEGQPHVVVRMRVPTAPLLMDFAEHTEES